ncbi:hypothetical protein FGO68_gene12679 [Halteria grandinella]|uniref:Uncharacterized protein n=1 Tax=Halteria grandinella TaxID=5974 RepID=A0A8J8P2T7_HALGN|nr:hypothetical protein FGO68_gene12679 [Halteria grandinella]
MKESTRLFVAPQSQTKANYSQLLIQAQEQKALASKLINLRPGIDNKEPKRYNHITVGRGQIEQQRQKQIDKENNMLLQKMLSIIKRKSSYNREHGQGHVLVTAAASANELLSSTFAANRGEEVEVGRALEITQPVNKSSENRRSGVAIGLNASNGHLQQSILNQDLPQTAPQLHALTGTLNYFQRKKEFDSIQQANLVMVRALKDTKPSMKRDDWRDHIKQYEKLKMQLNQRRNTTLRSHAPIDNLLPVLQPKSVSMASDKRILAFSQQTQSRSNRGALNGIMNKQDSAWKDLSHTQNFQANTHTNDILVVSDLGTTEMEVQKRQEALNRSSDFIAIKENAELVSAQVQFDPASKLTAYKNRRNNQSKPLSMNTTFRKPKDQRHTVMVDEHQKFQPSPKRPAYLQKMINSPLLNFNNYPSSILKRLSARVATADRTSRRAVNLSQLNGGVVINGDINTATPTNAKVPSRVSLGHQAIQDVQKHSANHLREAGETGNHIETSPDMQKGGGRVETTQKSNQDLLNMMTQGREQAEIHTLMEASPDYKTPETEAINASGRKVV